MSKYVDNINDYQDHVNYNVENILFDRKLEYPPGFQYLNDNIVNAFFSLLPTIANQKEFDILTFDTHFIKKFKLMVK